MERRSGSSARRRRSVLVASVALAAMVVAGCSSADDGTAGGSPATSGAPGTTAGPTTTGTAAGGGGPGSTPAPPEPDRPRVVAHRGASAYAPEHTFAAYDLAIEQGADYLEQDLQLTADGVLVVLHDDVLDRVARGPAESCTGPVADKTFDQLRQCEVGSWFNEAYPDRADPAYVGLTIPTMEEVLERYGTGVRYYIEIKSPADSPGMEAALLDLLDAAGLGDAEHGSVLVQSFSADSLRLLHETRPTLPLVQLVPNTGQPVDPAVLDDIATYAIGVGPAKALVDGPFVAAAHERCLEVHPYTVDDPAEMTSLIELGVDGMFTNRPDELLAVRVGTPGSPPPACEPAG